MWKAIERDEENCLNKWIQYQEDDFGKAVDEGELCGIWRKIDLKSLVGVQGHAN